MKRWWVILVALLGCEAGAPVDGGDGDRAVLAVDLEPLSAPLREAGRLPTAVDVALDGVVSASATLPAPHGLLPGHVAVAVVAERPLELVVRATYADGTTEATEPVVLQAGADEVLRVPVRLDGALALGAATRVALPLGTRLLVERGEAAEERTGRAGPLGRLLADPSVTAVTPYTEAPSPADELGALIPGERPAEEAPAEALGPAPARASAEAAPAAVAPTAATPTAATRATTPAEAARGDAAKPRIVSWRLLRVTMGGAPQPGELLYYYSYCSCGRPAPDRPYTIAFPDGRTLEGRTDPYGLVVVARGADGALDFGPTMRARPRAYAFAAGDPATHAAMLDALSSTDANTVLTALLDLRAEPLPEAREALVGLLDHAELALRLNAALALAAQPGADLEPVVARVAAKVAADPTTMLPVLGALRQPAGVRTALAHLEADDPQVRAAAAWALGMMGDPRALAPLEWALTDEDAAVRAQAALAVGRIGSYGSLDALEGMLADTSGDVVGRVREAMALATF